MTAPGPSAEPAVGRQEIGDGAALGLLGAGILAFFWPVLLGRVIPAPGDGMLHTLPHLALLGRALAAGAAPLWNPYEFSGFPWLATGQAGVLYPPNWIAALLPASLAMSVVVLFTYLLAAAGAYRLARHLGAPPPAALLAGYTFALSGFMIAHLGHTPMVNGAAWLPWLFLSIEHLRSRMRWPWFAAASGCIALQVAAGHFQVPAYGALALAAYVLVAGGEVPGWRARLGWLGRVALVGLVGGLLAAVQILPALELARASARTQVSYAFFSQYHLPLTQLPMVLFPYLFGGAQPPSPYPATYLGQGNFTELTGYPGVFPFVLAVSAGTALWRQPRVRAWSAVGVMALLLALGPATPLHRVMFTVPGYHWFRVPARHFMSFGLAVAILAALALGRMLDRQGEAMRRHAARCAWAVVGGMGLMAAVNAIRPAVLEGALPPAHPDAPTWGLALAVPLGIGVLAVVTVALLRRTPSRPVRGLAVFLALLDLASFGQFCEWRAGPAFGSLGRVSPPEGFLHRAAESPPRRVFAVLRDPIGDATWLGFPLAGAVHGLHSANGYDPLILARYAEFLGMSSAGVVPGAWRLASGRQLDLLGVHHVLVPAPRRYATQAGGLAILGPGDGIEYPVTGVEPVALSVVSTLAYGEALPGGTPVARVVAFSEAGESVAAVLRAGVETGAWDAGGPMTPAGLAPGQAVRRVFTVDAQGRVRIALSEARLPVEHPSRVVRVRIEHAAPALELLLGIGEVRAIGADGGAIRLTGHPAPRPVPAHWVRVFGDEAAEVYENPHALPRAWLVPAAVALRDDAAVLEAIRTGRLPDGRAFDPRAVALLSGRPPRPGTRDDADPDSRVVLRSLSANRIELEVRAPAGGYLVLSEVDYPGWRATLDGARLRPDRANYVLRGLPIPPGTHRVTFAFRPRSVLLGGLISLAAAVGLVGLAWPRRRQL